MAIVGVKDVCRGLVDKNRPRCFQDDNRSIRQLYDAMKIEPGDCLLISARESMGKTALLLTMLAPIIDEGKHVEMILTDECAESIVHRLVSIRTGIPLAKVIQMSEDVEDVVKKELDVLSNKHITFYEGRPTDDELVNHILAGGERDILVIDGLERILDSRVYDNVQTYNDIMRKFNCMREDYAINTFHDKDNIAFDNTNTYIENMLESLKEIGERDEFSIICTIQHSRITDYRSDHLPRVEDLRKYARIEDAADCIIFPFRWDVYTLHGDDEFERNRASIIIPKYKKGARNYFKVSWRAETLEFVDWEENYEDMFGSDQLEFELPDSFEPIDEDVLF